jgi:predicted esterase
VVEGFKLKALAERHGVVIVAPAGPDVYSAGRFTWDSGFEKSFKRIEEALEAAAKKYPIDKDKLITSGFSQGAGVALEVLYKHPKRVAGSVVFCPLAELFLMKPPDGVKGKVALVAREDEKSGFWPQVQETFRKKGGALVAHSITGMSHTLPAEFLTYFESWLLLTLEKMKK